MSSPNTLRKRHGKKVSVESDRSDLDMESEVEVTTAETVKPKEPTTWKKIGIRVAAGSAMVIFYISMLQAGHFYCILVAVLTQFELFRELVNVRYVEAKERSMPLFRTLQWSWFLLAMVFVCKFLYSIVVLTSAMYEYIYQYTVDGESFHNFCDEHSHLHNLTHLTEHLHKVLFVMYCVAFMLTVLTLKPGMIRFQLGQLMWTFVTIGLVVFQCKFLANNTFNGLFWFFFPMACVVNNDVSAYFCGITFGRKFIQAPFMSLSPNKTWEGFMGAAVCTVIFSFFFPVLLSKFTWFTCPATDIYIYEFPPPLECVVNDVFLPKEYMIPRSIAQVLFTLLAGANPMIVALLKLCNITVSTASATAHITLLPIQLHGIAYGLFASFIAPFGGFLASGIKRAYKVKDFDNFFPGHGGMMDRMDCILIMIFFTSIHYMNFIETKIPSVGHILALVNRMPPPEQAMVLAKLQEIIQ